jgi:hypothetical protein
VSILGNAIADNYSSEKTAAVTNYTAPISVTPIAYRCEIDGTFYGVTNKAACDQKIADTWTNFNPHAFAEGYKDALDNVAHETKPNK